MGEGERRRKAGQGHHQPGCGCACRKQGGCCACCCFRVPCHLSGQAQTAELKEWGKINEAGCCGWNTWTHHVDARARNATFDLQYQASESRQICEMITAGHPSFPVLQQQAAGALMQFAARGGVAFPLYAEN